MTFSAGDRIIVTMPRSAPREGEYVEGRGSKCKVLLDGDTETCVVLRERCKAVVARVVSVNHGVRTIVVDAEPLSADDRAFLVDAKAGRYLPRPVPKPPKPDRNARYLAYVREHICCSCEAKPPTEAHHFGPRGMSQKCSDYYAVPLCSACHRHFHDTGVVPNQRHEREREDTEALFAVTQADLLCAWVQTPEEIVEAMINHLRKDV